MNNAIASFVIISNCLNSGLDSIDAFIPFVIRLFNLKKYSEVNIETICHDFLDEYGLNVPRHPMETILNRMRPQFLTREANKIFINHLEIRKHAEKTDFESENKKYDWLIQNFIEFCRNYPTSIEVSYEEADSLFLNFLKSHDIDIIFAAYTAEKIYSLIPDVRNIEDSDKVYLLNRFVNDLLVKGGTCAEYLIDSAVGHKYASVLLYREFSNVRGRGACANYYLDVGLLFDVTGINNRFRKVAAEELLALISSKGSKLWVFRHNYDEFLQIIESTLYWIESSAIDLSRASRALQFFLNEGFHSSDIQYFISQIDSVLKKNNIQIALPLDPNQNQEYQIDRELLKQTILDIYNSNGIFDLEEREQTLELDIDSIEIIYKLRKYNVPVNLNTADYVFLTTNVGLAYASNRYEQIVLSRGYFTIPTVLTDTFVGTFLWVEEPTKIAMEYNRSKLIAYTNAVLAPRANLLNRFALEVNRAEHNEVNPISSESAFVLLSSHLTRKLLTDKTLGDPDRITASTPYEILAEAQALLVADERKRTEIAISEKEKALKSVEEICREKDIASQDLTSHISNVEIFINNVARIGKRIVIGALIAFAALIFIVTELGGKRTLFTICLSFGLFLLGLIISVPQIGEKFEKYVQSNLSKILLKRND